MVFKVESDHRDNVVCGRNWPVIFNAGKTELAPYDSSNNSYINRVKIDESDPERKPTFNLLKLPFIFLLDLGLYFVSIGKTVSIKIRALKVVSATLLLVYFSSLKKSTCEAWKNVFYFTSKTLFVLGKITFLYFRYSNFMTSSNA